MLTTLQIVGQVTQLIYQSIDANEENQVLEDVDNEPSSDSEDVAEGDSDDDANLTDAQRTKRNIRKERDAVGKETLKTADTSTGFASTYVDQQVKVKMKRQVQELFKQLEVQQSLSDSYSEFYKQIASSLGYSTSQANVSGAMSRIQGLAKSAEDKAVDTKFSMLEAAAKRENEIHGATKGAIMAASETVFAGIVKSVGRSRKSKADKQTVRGKDGGESRTDRGGDGVDSIMEILSSTGSALLTTIIASAAAEKITDDRSERQAENKDGKTKEVDAVGDAASSDRGQRLSGLEQRALNAQYNLGANQEMQQINQLLQETLDTIGKAWGGVMKQLVQYAGKEAAKHAKEFADSSKSSDDSKSAAAKLASGLDPGDGGDTPDAIENITDAMKDAQNKAVDDSPDVNLAAANKAIAENQSSASNDVDATKEVGTSDSKTSEQGTNQQLEEQAEKAIEDANEAEDPVENAQEEMRQGRMPDVSGMDFKDIQKLTQIVIQKVLMGSLLIWGHCGAKRIVK